MCGLRFIAEPVHHFSRVALLHFRERNDLFVPVVQCGRMLKNTQMFREVMYIDDIPLRHDASVANHVFQAGGTTMYAGSVVNCQTEFRQHFDYGPSHKKCDKYADL